MFVLKAASLLSVLAVAAMVAAAFPVTATDSVERSVFSGASWKQSNSTDFSGGSFTDGSTAVDSGSGDGAVVLSLESKWRPVAPPGAGAPPARMYTAMSYDSGAKATVVFGGSGMQEAAGNETWAYDSGSNRWTQMFPAASPPTRWGHVLAYDPLSGLHILFGGANYQDSICYGDTWSYDLKTNQWQNLTPMLMGKPSARKYSAISYVPSEGAFFIHGGQDQAGKAFNDTWAFKFGAGWTLHSRSLPRFQHQMAFDPNAGELFLYGGKDDSGFSVREMYRLNRSAGGGWLPVPATMPLAISLGCMCFDEALNALVFYGGQDENSQPKNTVWKFTYMAASVSYWTELAPKSPFVPGLSFGCSIAYDPQEKACLVYGGPFFSDPEVRNMLAFDSGNLWWNDKGWSPPGGPGHEAIALADGTLFGYGAGKTYKYDPAKNTWALLEQSKIVENASIAYRPPSAAPPLGEVYMFGGRQALLATNILRVFNFSQNLWEDVGAPGSPGPRVRTSMVYNPVKDEMFVYGGETTGSSLFDDYFTLSFGGASPAWTNITPVTTPPPGRSGHSMAFDPLSGKIVMFGGMTVAGLDNQTYVFDPNLGEWESPIGFPSPSRRSGQSLYFDPASKTLVAFGGRNEAGTELNDFWSFNSTQKLWSPIASLDSPPPRRNAAATLLPNGKVNVILFGAMGTDPLGDVWVNPSYRPAGSYISAKHQMSYYCTLEMAIWMDYEGIEWNSTGGFGSIGIRLRTAQTSAGLDTAQWHGPLGTDDIYTVPGTQINPTHDNQAFIQYQLVFNSSSGSTPELLDLTIHYTTTSQVHEPFMPLLACLLALAPAAAMIRRYKARRKIT